ncbi:MAG: hypothetical protein IPL84_03005 [Chitinophagaceae bacterium]|nr:hypothetical protein [Chitinophagaceae bacterium]
MKKIVQSALIFIAISCNNQAGNGYASVDDSSHADKHEKQGRASTLGNGDCSSCILFHEGAEIYTSSFGSDRKETRQQVSTVTKVYSDGGMTIAEMEMKDRNTNNGDEKGMNAVYKCDGRQLYVDLAGFLSENKSGNMIATSGLLFPFNVAVGETLPDADYSINMNMSGRAMKVTSHIKERKVEAKEPVTTAAGTFECYRISSVIESETEIPGMNEKTKQIMEEAKKKMGQSKMIFWYAPDVSIIKTEFYMGDKLVSGSEVTGFKK